MTRHLLFSSIICLALFNHAAAQQPSYGYRFTLVDANGKSITDADSAVSISSINPDGSFYRHIRYEALNSNIETTQSWLLYEYFRQIRGFNLIQILNKKSRDTMTIFYRKHSKYHTYAVEDNKPSLDTIKFSKGYYVAHNRPSLKDWNRTRRSKKLEVFSIRTDFLNYITAEIDKPVLLSQKHQEIEPPAPIALSRFTNLVYPVQNGEKTGKIVVRFFADKDGRVTNAIPSVKGTTIADKDLSQQCKEAMMKSRLLQPDKTIESGTVVFHFKLKQ